VSLDNGPDVCHNATTQLADEGGGRAMGKVRLATFVVVLVGAAAAAYAVPAEAARVDQVCEGPSGGNGATTCTLIIRESISGQLGSDVVTGCLGEDVFLNLDVQVVAHQTFRPDGTLDTKAGATIHGTGYGVVTGTPIVFNENAEAFVDNLPDGGEIFHIVSPAEVNTAGGAPNLEFTIETQFVVAPDGTVTNGQLNAQARCGSEREHLHE
jgi:hypothetical protein